MLWHSKNWITTPRYAPQSLTALSRQEPPLVPHNWVDKGNTPKSQRSRAQTFSWPPRQKPLVTCIGQPSFPCDTSNAFIISTPTPRQLPWHNGSSSMSILRPCRKAWWCYLYITEICATSHRTGVKRERKFPPPRNASGVSGPAAGATTCSPERERPRQTMTRLRDELPEDSDVSLPCGHKFEKSLAFIRATSRSRSRSHETESSVAGLCHVPSPVLGTNTQPDRYRPGIEHSSHPHLG